MSHRTPPFPARLMLRLALDPCIHELVMGDLEEEFAERLTCEGRRRARRWYWKQALTSSAKGRRPLHGFPGPRRSPHDKEASLMDSLIQDLRHTVRAFARNPGFVIVAVITLALGIGATTGVFSLANWLMLRPVPGVAGQERLAFVDLGIHVEGGLRVSSLSYPNFQDFAARLTQVESFAGYSNSSISASVSTEGAINLPAQFVTASYVDVLGLESQLGRWFSAEEDDPAAPTYVAVISSATWRRMYGGDPSVLGRDLVVNGRPFAIVGVAADSFEGPLLGGGVGAWLPGSAYPWANHYEDVIDYAERGSGSYYEFIARAASGTSWERVQAELSAASQWLAERYPEDNAKFLPRDGSEAVAFHVYPGIGTHPLSRSIIGSTLRLMLGMAALVLLIACANVANLLLVRGIRRGGEIAVRKSLGANRWRLMRQQLTEGVVLWAVGGIAGLGVALLLMRSFAGTQLVGSTMVEFVSLDTRVLAFASALALLTGLAFSVFPAWIASRVDAARTLQAGSDGSRGRKNRLRTVFGAAQLSASLTLLVGALLFARTIDNMVRVDPGIDPSNVTAAFLYPTDIGYSVEGAVDYFDRLRQALAAHPGSTNVALSAWMPLHGLYGRAREAGGTDSDYLQVLTNSVTDAYFEMLSIPLVKGRTFTADEVRSGAQVMVVNQALASALFGEVDPLGRSVEVPMYRADPTYYEVVGVVGNTRFGDLTEAPEPGYYVVRGKGLGSDASRAVVLLETHPSANGQEILRATIAGASPSLAPRRVESVAESVRQATSQSRMLARLLTVLATVAAALSAVGLYGTVSAITAQRTFEFGIRVALGSSPGRIIGLVLKSASSVAGLGLAAGLFGAWSLSRAIESRLYGVERLDPTSWTVAVLLLVAVIFAAAMVPARRASRLDPVETLRSR